MKPGIWITGVCVVRTDPCCLVPKATRFRFPRENLPNDFHVGKFNWTRYSTSTVSLENTAQWTILKWDHLSDRSKRGLGSQFGAALTRNLYSFR